MEVSAEEFAYLSEYIKRHSGISLAEDKMYLMESRLLPLIRKYELDNVSALVAALRSNTNADISTEIIEALTTNETSFFRDMNPFNVFRDTVAPELIEKVGTSRKIRIWCAACSTGQEPYSLAMTIMENSATYIGYDYEILGSDIDTAVLDKARNGIYTQFEVQRGLQATMMVKYFTQDNNDWRLKDTVKSMTSFEQVNLIENISELGMFDVIFCRNVLIYFEEDMKKQIIENISQMLYPHGFLFLGCSESTQNLSDKFTKVEGAAGVFRLG